jgi:predicted lipid carrier protein YhbT
MIGDRSEGATLTGSVHIHCTDVPGEWLVTPSDDGLVVTREHAKGDAAIRGTASDLNLVMWRRTPLTAVEVIGDATVAEQLVAYASLE